MILLTIAALIWLGIHIGIAGTSLRGILVARIGEMPFRGVFSLLSILAIVFLVWSWSAAWTAPLWYAPAWLGWVLVAVMLAAFVLFVASLAAGDAAAGRPPRGIHRITRHPMLWSFALWAVVHIIGAGDSAAIVFFGTFLVTALFGMPSIDGKLARRDPSTWQALSAVTSLVPFAAIAQRRNRFVPGEIGWLPALVGTVAWATGLYLHPWLFGVSPVAM